MATFVSVELPRVIKDLGDVINRTIKTKEGIFPEAIFVLLFPSLLGV